MTSNPSERLAPHSAEAEEAVLGAALLDKYIYLEMVAIDNPNRLYADDFYMLRHTWIWQAFEKIIERNEEIDNLSVMEQLRSDGHLDEVGGGSYLSHLINNCPSALYASYTYAPIVKRAAERRRGLNAASQIANLSTSPELTIEQYREGVQRVINETFVNAPIHAESAKVSKSAGDAMLEIYSEYIDEAPPDTLPSCLGLGFENWNGGAFERGTHIGILAASGTGKTALSKQQTLFLAQKGYKIAYVLQESTAKQFTRRIACELLGVNSRIIRERRKPTDPHCPKCSQDTKAQLTCDCREKYYPKFMVIFKRAVEYVISLPFEIIDNSHGITSIDNFDNRLERTSKLLGGLDSIVVDYGQKVGFNARNMTLDNAHGIFAQKITAAAQTHNALAITLLQVRKEDDAGLTEPPSANDIRGTSVWYNELDYLYALWLNKGTQITELHMRKAREAQQQERPLNLKLNGKTVAFEFLF